MSASPNFISTPRIGIGEISTGQTARTTGTTTSLVDVLTAVTAGTRVLEIIIKSLGQPADSVVQFWLHNGTTTFLFDEIDIGAPTAASTTAVGYRLSTAYTNLIIPSGWKLMAGVTVTPTSGNILVIALGGDLT